MSGKPDRVNAPFITYFAIKLPRYNVMTDATEKHIYTSVASVVSITKIARVTKRQCTVVTNNIYNIYIAPYI